MAEPTRRDEQEAARARAAADARAASSAKGAGPPRDTGSRKSRYGALLTSSPTVWSRHVSAVLAHAQEVLALGVVSTLLFIAGDILVTTFVKFFSLSNQEPVAFAATEFLDRVLLVLILVEIIHTVLLSVREHELSPQPFIVVGLVAVIREVLIALGGTVKVSDETLGIYVGMVAVFVLALIALEMFDGHRRRRRGSSDEVGIKRP